jgi:hypothetical protein
MHSTLANYEIIHRFVEAWYTLQCLVLDALFLMYKIVDYLDVAHLVHDKGAIRSTP